SPALFRKFDRVARGDAVQFLELEVDLPLLFGVLGVGELLLKRLLVFGELLLQLDELAAEWADWLVGRYCTQAAAYQDQTGEEGASHWRTAVRGGELGGILVSWYGIGERARARMLRDPTATRSERDMGR